MDNAKKREKFNKIIEGIKEVKIQGAQNVAKKSIEAYKLFPNKQSKKKLLSLRPTEPLLKNVLNKLERNLSSQSYKEIENHFKKVQENVNESILKLIHSKDVIFTHCHSSTVNNAFIHAKNKGKNFEVYATETRPLYQGRKTVKELSKAKIKTTLFVDSAAQIALTKNQNTKKADKFFIGADALLDKGIVNKIGSGMFANIAHENKIPVYVFSDSWKYSKEKVKMEKRPFKEISKGWIGKGEKRKFKVENPAFEFIDKKYIKAVVSEYGILPYDKFLKKVRNA